MHVREPTLSVRLDEATAEAIKAAMSRLRAGDMPTTTEMTALVERGRGSSHFPWLVLMAFFVARHWNGRLGDLIATADVDAAILATSASPVQLFSIFPLARAMSTGDDNAIRNLALSPSTSDSIRHMAWTELGLLAFDAGDVNEAVECLDRSLRVNREALLEEIGGDARLARRLLAAGLLGERRDEIAAELDRLLPDWARRAGHRPLDPGALGGP